MAVDANKQIVNRMLEAFSTGNEALVDELVDIGHVDETPFPGTTADKHGLKTQIQAVRRAFPDVKFALEKVIAEGDQVAFRWRMEGTQKGPLLGHNASNKKFVHHGNDFVTIRDGKIVGHHSADNIRDLLATLGLAPEPRT